MGRKGVVIPVSQKADVKPRGYELEFIGEKKNVHKGKNRRRRIKLSGPVHA